MCLVVTCPWYDEEALEGRGQSASARPAHRPALLAAAASLRPRGRSAAVCRAASARPAPGHRLPDTDDPLGARCARFPGPGGADVTVGGGGGRTASPSAGRAVRAQSEQGGGQGALALRVRAAVDARPLGRGSAEAAEVVRGP